MKNLQISKQGVSAGWSVTTCILNTKYLNTFTKTWNIYERLFNIFWSSLSLYFYHPLHTRTWGYRPLRPPEGGITHWDSFRCRWPGTKWPVKMLRFTFHSSTFYCSSWNTWTLRLPTLIVLSAPILLYFNPERSRIVTVLFNCITRLSETVTDNTEFPVYCTNDKGRFRRVGFFY